MFPGALLTMGIWPHIVDQIELNSGLALDPREVRTVSGGCINSAYLLGSGDLQVFVKTNTANQSGMFIAEAAGLQSLSEAKALQVPEVFCTGISGNHAYIAMQAIHMRTPTALSYSDFGYQLATMHRYHKPSYGASLDNTIGATPQANSWSDSWIDFWRKHRLGYQIELARHNQAPTALIDSALKLNDNFEKLFDHVPAASCLHGDLWSGNWGFDKNGNAVIFDPAHYFGDRETDLAMTQLFGGAPPEFYHSYAEAYPLEEGYPLRKTFYNIYHILNHYNLFGSGYATQAHNMIQNVLSELF